MSARAEELAARLERANEEVIAAIQGANGNLGATCPAEGWTVAAVGSHIGYGHVGIVEGLIKPIVEGRELPPFKLSDFDEGNARHAREHAAVPQDQVLQLLRDHGAQASSYVRGLSDDDLDRPTTLPLMGDTPVTAQQVIEMVLIGHVLDHGNSLRQSLG
jgi:hypothetical protein